MILIGRAQDAKWNDLSRVCGDDPFPNVFLIAYV